MTESRVVPDTSVLVDGRITLMVEKGDLDRAHVIVPQAVVAELESQANKGLESGFNGLDELARLQDLAKTKRITLEFAGTRPSLEAIELAAGGEIDAMIRGVAQEKKAKLVTSDRVLAHVCGATGIDYEYLRPAAAEPEFEALAIHGFFDEETMSVHLKQDVVPTAKKGKPGAMRLEKLGRTPMKRKELRAMMRELIEAARRDPKSFVEIERHGATVVQLRNMRIAIAIPPFSDAIEITAVRPVTKLDIEAYELPPPVLERLSDYSRGVFVSGPPGSGKSTFAQAVAEFLHARNAIVKTMESPRDLNVHEEITQYAPLDKSMELTSDILLLVRPDYVIYDEVRKTSDFETFGDMRLAGVGLIGVTHANRAIDAIQRLIGRVELGMIPQVVDTVIHIVKGRIQQILELDFSVRVPSGMTEADLARPVIVVRDFLTKQETHEIYTYGEQIVVMPIQEGRGGTGVDRLAEGQLLHMLRRQVHGDVEVEIVGPDQAKVYVEDWEVPKLIGKGGQTVQALEREVGMSLEIAPLEKRPRTARNRKWQELIPAIHRSKNTIVLVLEPELAEREAEVLIDGEPVLVGTISRKGEIRVKKESDVGRDILRAHGDGRSVVVRL